MAPRKQRHMAHRTHQRLKSDSPHYEVSECLMKRVPERDGWRCRKWGSVGYLQVHHKVKRNQQGNDALGDLVTLSAHCHVEDHGQLYYSRRAATACSKPKPRRKLGPCLA